MTGVDESAATDSPFGIGSDFLRLFSPLLSIASLCIGDVSAFFCDAARTVDVFDFF